MSRTWLILTAFTVGGCQWVFSLDRRVDAGDDPRIDAPFDTVVPDGLIAWYPMDDLDGVMLRDVTANTHDGVCVNCPRKNVGIVSGSLAFNGTNDHIQITSEPDLESPAAFTVTLWAYVDKRVVPYSCIVSKPLGMAVRNSWQLCLSDGRPVVTWSTGQLTFPDQVPLIAWQHYALRWDGTSLIVAINGVNGTPRLATMEFDEKPLLMGADIDEGMLVAFFDGSIDDVRIYNRLLSEGELAQLYAHR